MGLGRSVTLPLFIGLAVSACALQPQNFLEIPVPPARVEQQGYSFVPLNEKGWQFVARNAYQVALAKYGTKPDETFAIQATLLKLPAYSTPDEFLGVVKDGQERDMDPKRFRILKYEVIALAGRATDCTKSHAVAEDNGALRRTSRRDIMVLEMLSLTCAHPRSKGVGVNVAYSHRHYPGDEDPNFAQKATQVIEGVQFTSM